MTSADRVVLVFEATGRPGGLIAAALKASGWKIADVVSLHVAMQGAYDVFSLQPSSGQGTRVSDEDELHWELDLHYRASTNQSSALAKPTTCCPPCWSTAGRMQAC